MLDLDDAESRKWTFTLLINEVLFIVLSLVPGWPKLEQYARKMWGDGDWTITINPPGVS